MTGTFDSRPPESDYDYREFRLTRVDVGAALAIAAGFLLLAVLI